MRKEKADLNSEPILEIMNKRNVEFAQIVEKVQGYSW